MGRGKGYFIQVAGGDNEFSVEQGAWSAIFKSLGLGFHSGVASQLDVGVVCLDPLESPA